jgi:GDP-L-fucose synthase
MINSQSKIYIAGHNGLIGSTLYNLLKINNFNNILVKNRSQLDLKNKKKVTNFFKKNKIDCMIMCAARVGGILENKTYPIEFLLDNLAIQNNLLMAAKKYKVKRIIFLGSSCIYPKESKIPIKETYIMDGKCEKTNEAYAIAKIAGIKLCSILHDQYDKDIICLMPTNVYGENDNFDSNSSHVIPGMITKFIDANKNKKNIKLWGTGKPIREFIHAEDLVSAILFLMCISKNKLKKISNNQMPIINVGTGESITIKKLALLIKKLTNFQGKVIFDKNYPDGTLNKNLDSSKLKKLGWKANILFESGLKKVILDRLKH